jgi:hypothetical protein
VPSSPRFRRLQKFSMPLVETWAPDVGLGVVHNLVGVILFEPGVAGVRVRVELGSGLHVGSHGGLKILATLAGDGEGPDLATFPLLEADHADLVHDPRAADLASVDAAVHVPCLAADVGLVCLYLA